VAEDGTLIKLAGKEFRALRATVVQLMGVAGPGSADHHPKDAATIVFQLGLRAGETVLEAGVGSAGLTMRCSTRSCPRAR
jgi:tRNA (adenine57-N1/adenine58-N1)-methyltransferase